MDYFRGIKLSSEYLSIFDFMDPTPFNLMPSLPSLQSYKQSSAASNAAMDSFFMPPAIQSSWLLQETPTGKYRLATDPQILLQPLSTTVPSFMMQNSMAFGSLLPMAPTASLDCLIPSLVIPTNPNLHHGSFMESPKALPTAVKPFPAANIRIDMKPATPTSSQAIAPVIADNQDYESDSDNTDVYSPSKTGTSKITIKRDHKRKSSSPACSTTSSKSDSQDHKNKSRFRFSSAQQTEMIERYNADPFPSYESMTKTAQEFGTTFHKIKIWYQNHRCAEKRRTYAGKKEARS
ncbi:UNVERIFIED_CONTAM: hypothetical protein HDU68_010201 [Siphonaria sp. JEL0065]|nr:hypothetical protein HDU68_010201 [Siphonaria sp. JEL0065]